MRGLSLEYRAALCACPLPAPAPVNQPLAVLAAAGRPALAQAAASETIFVGRPFFVGREMGQSSLTDTCARCLTPSSLSVPPRSVPLLLNVVSPPRRPTLSLGFGSAPLSSSIRTASERPLWAAQRRAVSPSCRRRDVTRVRPPARPLPLRAERAGRRGPSIRGPAQRLLAGPSRI